MIAKKGCELPVSIKSYESQHQAREIASNSSERLPQPLSQQWPSHKAEADVLSR